MTKDSLFTFLTDSRQKQGSRTPVVALALIRQLNLNFSPQWTMWSWTACLGQEDKKEVIERSNWAIAVTDGGRPRNETVHTESWLGGQWPPTLTTRLLQQDHYISMWDWHEINFFDLTVSSRDGFHMIVSLWRKVYRICPLMIPSAF